MTTEHSRQPITPESEPPGRFLGLFALGLGVVGLLSSWTGWGGIAVGAAAVVLAIVALAIARRAAGRMAVAGLVLGVVAVGVGGYVERDTLFGDDDAHFGIGLSLDECMRNADTAKLQHLCKSQHLGEFMQRYPRSDE